MQVNDAMLIERNPGTLYVKDGKLNDQYFSFALQAASLLKTYAPILRESLPGEIVRPYLEFDQGPQGRQIADILVNMNNNAAADYPAGTVDKWATAVGERITLNQQLIAKAGTMLESLAAERASTIRTRLAAYSGATLVVLLATTCLCWRIPQIISNLVRTIARRMSRLAEGDKAMAIPLIERTDVLGEIARALEVFRHAAIRNDELEAAAAAAREKSERERIEVQARAEREAEARLTQATASLAAGLRKLAAGDLLCEIKEAFARQFEPLRGDFNSSTKNSARGAGLRGRGCRNRRRTQRRGFDRARTIFRD